MCYASSNLQFTEVFSCSTQAALTVMWHKKCFLCINVGHLCIKMSTCWTCAGVSELDIMWHRCLFQKCTQKNSGTLNSKKRKNFLYSSKNGLICVQQVRCVKAKNSALTNFLPRYIFPVFLLQWNCFNQASVMHFFNVSL